MPLQRTRLASEGEEAVRINPRTASSRRRTFNNSQGTQTLIWIKSRSRRNW